MLFRSASGYELVNASTARTQLGLGSAATLNVGTAVGQIPQIVSGTGGPALPSLSGENLTGLAKAIDTCVIVKANGDLTNTGTSGTLWFGYNGAWNNICMRKSGASTLGLTILNAPASGWATLSGTSSEKVTLTQGVYEYDLSLNICPRYFATPAGTDRPRVRIEATSGTIAELPFEGRMFPETVGLGTGTGYTTAGLYGPATGPGQQFAHTMRGRLTVSTSTAEISIKGTSALNSTANNGFFVNHSGSSDTSEYCLQLNLRKLS